MSDIFKEASKMGLRFPTSLGNLSVEDLWHLNLNVLDELAIGYKDMIESTSNESFLRQKTTSDGTLELRLDIAKSIIEERLDDAEAIEKKTAIREQNKKIMELIVEKENDELKDSSIEELRAMLKTNEG